MAGSCWEYCWASPPAGCNLYVSSLASRSVEAKSGIQRKSSLFLKDGWLGVRLDWSYWEGLGHDTLALKCENASVR